MAKSRLLLQETLESILGSNKVYFQAPTKVTYPCIIYELSDRDELYADNLRYKTMKRYTIMLIGKNPDNDETVNKILDLDYCSFDRRYISDNLYHDVFDIYY